MVEQSDGPGLRIDGSVMPRIMAILNVTPDSFSDGGQFVEPGSAADAAVRFVAEGADILDIGAESTRPGFAPISAEVELRRLIPVLDRLPAAFGRAVPVPVSVDTTKADVARAALQRGVTWINDIWGFQGDPRLPDVVAEFGASAVLMHNRGSVDAALDIVDDLLRFFETSLSVAERAGVARDKLILDPGIGFGKTPSQQLVCLNRLGELKRTFGLRVLVGLSRKSFLRPLVGDDAPMRLFGTIAANLSAVEHGADIVRVHDVAAHAAAFRVHQAIGRAGS